MNTKDAPDQVTLPVSPGASDPAVCGTAAGSIPFSVGSVCTRAPGILAKAFGPYGCALIGDASECGERPLVWFEPLRLIAGPNHWRRRAAQKRPFRYSVRPAYRAWTPEDDATLCDGIADGKTFREVAGELNRTKDSCIGRFHRIAARMDA